VEGSSHAKNQLDSFSRFSRTPTCNGRTDRHRAMVIVPRMYSIARQQHKLQCVMVNETYMAVYTVTTVFGVSRNSMCRIGQKSLINASHCHCRNATPQSHRIDAYRSLQRAFVERFTRKSGHFMVKPSGDMKVR